MSWQPPEGPTLTKEWRSHIDRVLKAAAAVTGLKFIPSFTMQDIPLMVQLPESCRSCFIEYRKRSRLQQCSPETTTHSSSLVAAFHISNRGSSETEHKHKHAHVYPRTKQRLRAHFKMRRPTDTHTTAMDVGHNTARIVALRARLT